jgi:flavin-binding protein dodecin
MEGDTGAAEGGADPVMDRKAMDALRTRIREMREQAALSVREHEELSALTQELARATGLGGRIRSFADAPERARTAVRKALKRAIDEITAANAAVGQHLAGRIETGAVCCYHVETFRPADAG